MSSAEEQASHEGSLFVRRGEEWVPVLCKLRNCELELAEDEQNNKDELPELPDQDAEDKKKKKDDDRVFTVALDKGCTVSEPSSIEGSSRLLLVVNTMFGDIYFACDPDSMVGWVEAFKTQIKLAKKKKTSKKTKTSSTATTDLKKLKKSPWRNIFTQRKEDVQDEDDDGTPTSPARRPSLSIVKKMRKKSTLKVTKGIEDDGNSDEDDEETDVGDGRPLNRKLSIRKERTKSESVVEKAAEKLFGKKRGTGSPRESVAAYVASPRETIKRTASGRESPETSTRSPNKLPRSDSITQNSGKEEDDEFRFSNISSVSEVSVSLSDEEKVVIDMKNSGVKSPRPTPNATPRVDGKTAAPGSPLAASSATNATVTGTAATATATATATTTVTNTSTTTTDSKDDKKDDKKDEKNDEEEKKKAKTPEDEEKLKKKQEEREAKRKHISQEILSTEQSYIQMIGLAIKEYMGPLIKNCANFGETADTVKKIFGDLGLIHGFNAKLLQELEKIVSQWNPESLLGPVFLKMGPFLKMYTAYSNKYVENITIYNDLMENNPKFAVEVQACREKSGSQLKLADVLIMPIQRIPRYSLLLSDLLRHTEHSHKDYPALQESLDKIMEVAAHINEAVRRAENSKKVEAMQEKGIKLKSIIKPHRYMIKEGTVKVEIKANHPYNTTVAPYKDSYVFLLFNDIFIHVKKDRLKQETTFDQPHLLWPLMLVWVYGEGNKISMYGPTETITFTDNEGDDAWRPVLDESIKANLAHKNKGKKRINTLAVRKGNYTFPNGQGTYKGEWLDGKRHGKGIFTLQNTEYLGRWKEDKQHGKGRMTYATGDVYTGQWANGLPNGKGELRLPDGTRYIGLWAKGVREGKGKCTWSNGDSYQGNWMQDKISGEGRMTTASGTIYQGTFEDNLFHGVGKLRLANGLEYEGEWVYGAKHGRGNLKYPSGATYQGDWEEDTRHGRGAFLDTDNSRYTGDWIHDIPEGTGTKEWPDGTVYDGKWIKGFRHGKGKCVYANGTVYDGMWEADRRHGEGEFTEEDDTHYKGTWVRDLREGKGVLTFSNGAQFKGTFLNSQFHKHGVYTGAAEEFIVLYEGEWLHGKMNGKGLIKFKNGDSYKGGFKNGTFHGHGIYVYANGTTFDCKWHMGMKIGKVAVLSGAPGSFSLTSMNSTLSLEESGSSENSSSLSSSSLNASPSALANSGASGLPGSALQGTIDQTKNPFVFFPATNPLASVIHVSPGLPNLPFVYDSETAKSAMK